MSKFSIKKKIQLDYLGEGWAGCFLEFNAPSIAELNESISGLEGFDEKDPGAVKENFAKTMNLLESNFVSGKGFVGKEVIDLTKDDLKEFPAEVINKALDFLVSESVKSE